MFSDELFLIKQVFTSDEIGNQISKDEENKVFCNVKSVARDEFYNASLAGLKPSVVFIIHNYEYNDEKIIKYNNKKYYVIRTYRANSEYIELTCKEGAGVEWHKRSRID